MMLHVINRSRPSAALMFSILRFILIVGAIFYYSPVRQRGDAPASLEALMGWAKADGAAKAADSAHSERLETMWQALPESAKQAVIDKILTTSGLGSDTKATDTLQPGDRHPAWRDGNKPRL
jgi:exoribonuclease R